MAYGNLAYRDERDVTREEVHHRTRLTLADGRSLAVVVVNISPHGFMARCEAVLAEGDAVRIALPGVGATPARVRWSLGGRIGCQFDRMVGLAPYYELLAALLR
ncbi:PilZ domain-containing protein [Sphingomonas sp.]|uniref:PilZ domain-containing protein n=1 Tax=Sphingomonas sp. TaxID=28214 RepID=UPI002DD637FD|nr:PilZ domain-containing protein [Sphingomonas sp.]